MTAVFLGFLLGMLNPPNRRIRFRMYGGVGGAESQDSPLSRLTAAGAEAIRTLQVNLDIVDLNYLSGQIPTFTR
jgi:hypothetical protein